MAKLIQGYFKPRNPGKYKGNPTNIRFLSGWELRLMKRFDVDPSILEWSSEEVLVPYVSPKDKKVHMYMPDFVIKTKSKTGKIETKMIEVKPYSQTIEPKKKEKPTKRYITEVLTWGVNEAKWESAKKFCSKKGWDFVLITEFELGIKKR